MLLKPCFELIKYSFKSKIQHKIVKKKGCIEMNQHWNELLETLCPETLIYTVILAQKTKPKTYPFCPRWNGRKSWCNCITLKLTLISVSSTPVLSAYSITLGWAENSHHRHDDLALKYMLLCSSRTVCILMGRDLLQIQFNFIHDTHIWSWNQ